MERFRRIKKQQKVRVIGGQMKLWLRLKGIVIDIEKIKSDDPLISIPSNLTIELNRVPRKIAHLKTIKISEDLVEVIDDAEFQQIDFVDTGSKVEIINGKREGLMGSISGCYIGPDKDLLRVYVDVEYLQDDVIFYSLLPSSIRIISEEEYKKRSVVSKHNQLVLFT